jgi:hypothetical protein
VTFIRTYSRSIILAAGIVAAALLFMPVIAAADQLGTTASKAPSQPVLTKISPAPGLTVSPLELVDTFQSFTSLLEEKALDGTFNPGDFEKLDFSIPGDHGFGSNPEYEVFNPNGKFRIPADQQAFKHYQDLVDSVTNHKNVRDIFNLRRSIAADGTITDALYKILSDVKPQACADEAAHIVDMGTQRHPAASLPLPEAFKIMPDNHTIVVDPSPVPIHSVCLQASDGKLYTFRWICARFKKLGDGTWQIR